MSYYFRVFLLDVFVFIKCTFLDEKLLRKIHLCFIFLILKSYLWNSKIILPEIFKNSVKRKKWKQAIILYSSCLDLPMHLSDLCLMKML